MGKIEIIGKPTVGGQLLLDRYNAFEPDGAVRRAIQIIERQNPDGLTMLADDKVLSELKKLCGEGE